MRSFLSPGRLGAVVLLLLAVTAGVLFLAPASDTYIFLPDEAHRVAPLISVEGGKGADGAPGGIYYLDVIVRRATLLERLIPSLRKGSDLVPAEAINPSGVSDEVRRQSSLRQMTRSQVVAAAVALRELGYEVTARPTGALIVEIVPDAPADGKLQPTDVVTDLDGNRVRGPADLRRLLRRKPPGSSVTLTVRRGGEVTEVSLVTARDPRERSRPVIGVLPEQATDVRLPIDVRIDTNKVGGPSAGLAFALDVLEELGRDVDRGYKVAVTGAIDLDGAVLPIGGVRQKTIGARRSGVDVMLVPAGENAAEARRHAGGLRVIPVGTFRQAIQKLAALPARAA